MRSSNTATLPAVRIASTEGADVCRRSLNFLMKSQAKPPRQTETTQRQKKIQYGEKLKQCYLETR